MDRVKLVQVAEDEESHAVDWSIPTGKVTLCQKGAMFPLGGTGDPSCPECRTLYGQARQGAS